MANRIPLIVNPSSNQIQELPAIDNLDLANSSIVGIDNLSATTATISGNLVVTGTIVGNVAGIVSGGGGSGSSGVSSNARIMAIIFGR
jgi:hypothetical protein